MLDLRVFLPMRHLLPSSTSRPPVDQVLSALIWTQARVRASQWRFDPIAAEEIGTSALGGAHRGGDTWSDRDPGGRIEEGGRMMHTSSAKLGGFFKFGRWEHTSLGDEVLVNIGRKQKGRVLRTDPELPFL